LTVSDSKTSCNIEPPLILARFVSPQLLPVPKGEVAALDDCFLQCDISCHSHSAHEKVARFDTIEEIQKAMTDQLNKIRAEDFSNAMKKLETHANLCITSDGSYFE